MIPKSMIDCAVALNPQFNTREEYFTWRKNWREVYKSVSADIRSCKIMLGVTSRLRVLAYVPLPNTDGLTPAQIAACAATTGEVLRNKWGTNALGCGLEALRLLARKLLSARLQSKLTAGKQRAANQVPA